MTRPLIETAQSDVAVRDILRDALADQAEEWASGATVSTKPAPVSPDPRTAPHVQVASDGGVRSPTLYIADTIRVLIHYPDEGIAGRLALRIEALAHTGLSSADVRHIRPRTRPFTTPDPDTGEPMAVVGLTAAMTPR